MAPLLKTTSRFDKESRRLIRKFRSLRNELDLLKIQLRSGDRPGVRLAGTGHIIYKVRLPNRSAGRGKSGGFRVIYEDRSGQLVLLLLIYTKTEHSDIPNEVIRQLIMSAD